MSVKYFISHATDHTLIHVIAILFVKTSLRPVSPYNVLHHGSQSQYKLIFQPLFTLIH